jgi:uncharacterized protein YyaL (SSP411 family)
MTAKKNPSNLFAMIDDTMAMREMIESQTEGMRKAQAELLDGVEEITRDWLDRRREDNETALKAAERMTSSGDVSDVLVAYFDWLGGAVRRLTEDATALSEKYFEITASVAMAGRNGASAPRIQKTARTSKPKTKAEAKEIQTKAKAIETKAKAIETKPQTAVQQVAAAQQAIIQKQRLAS